MRFTKIAFNENANSQSWKVSCKGKHNEDISDANFEPNVIMLAGVGKGSKD